jgi:hypothetical protein
MPAQTTIGRAPPGTQPTRLINHDPPNGPGRTSQVNTPATNRSIQLWPG